MMQVLYIAKHGQRNNDDEGSIAHALRCLGHDVIIIPEHKARYKINRYKANFLLFHHWSDLGTLEAFDGIPKVFWCFDLIRSPRHDSTLVHRNQRRIGWIDEITRIADLGFCTDGDWVDRDRTGKLIHLMQGADERVVGYGQKSDGQAPILFVGSEKGGKQRQSFVQEMLWNWKDKSCR